MSVQFSRSVVSNSLRPHELQHTRPPHPSTNSQSLPKLMSTESVMPSNHLILCRPLLPSVFPSIRVFSNESALRIRRPKDWSLLSFFFLAALLDMLDLSSLTKDQTCAPCIGSLKS